MNELQIGSTALELRQGDITQVAVDAIVNAANSALVPGSGVAGAIHRAGGPGILAECLRIGGCPTGSAVITGAGNLPARHVIHAVAPIYRNAPDDPRLLRSAYAAGLRLAEEAGDRTIACPSLGTGAYGWPVHLAAPIALGTVADHLRAGSALTLVIFVLFSQSTLTEFQSVLAQLAGAEE